MKWKDIREGFLDLLFPPRETCPLCGGRSAGAVICRQCLDWLEEYRGIPCCPVCGRFIELPREGFSGPGVEPCDFCRLQRPSFHLGRAVAPYRGVLREAVLHLKYRRTTRVAAALAGLMAETARRESAFARANLILPVPLSPGRAASRGFNQAELLAVEVGRELGLPVDKNSLVKVKETGPQAGLSRAERLLNLQGAFDVNSPAAIRGKSILLIDDVLTSGATMENISNRLRQDRAKEVFVLTAAGGIVPVKSDTRNKL